MLKGRSFWVLSAFFFCFLSAWAQSACGGLHSERLLSPSVGKRFFEIAYELVNSPDVSEAETEEAIIFLTATMNLDSSADYALPVVIKTYLASCSSYLEPNTPRDPRDALLYELLASYLDETADLEVATKVTSYLLEQLNTREEREKLLEDLLKDMGGKSSRSDSELATLLGLLKAEKADLKSAQSYLRQAYNNNRYNRLAFAKLAEIAPEQISPAMYMEQLRLALGENPLDMKAALALAQYAERLQLYDIAADAYGYCADLFDYLYPSQDLPDSIYLPWAISSYNTQRKQHKCLQIAERIRQSGRFDLLLEAIAGKTAAKTGNERQATQILKAAEDKVLQLPTENRESEIQLAWFYCFALPDANKALDWANKAYSTDPNSDTAAALLAYSLVISGQTDWAKTFIDTYEHNQIADLTLAQIQWAQGQRDSAIETLKSAIARDPGSLVAERAKETLAQLGSEYIPPIDPDIVLTTLKNSFGQAVVPAFNTPENMISVRLNVRGSEFSYGSEFSGTVAIMNSSSEPLVISDDGLIRGNIRIDAYISGDLDKKIPNLVSVKIRPALPVQRGRSISIPVRLFTAELRRTLLTHPQASIDVKFTVYLDPAVTNEGKLTNRLVDVKPAGLLIKRPGVELTGRYLRNRLNSLRNGRQGQKIQTAQLFAGLLMEQHAMANREAPYKLVYADWMPALLKSALTHNLADKDWVVKVYTMSAMLSVPLDYELISAVAENLNDTHWPVRLMAIYLLAKSRGSDFDKVLDWTAKYDSNELVRAMTIALVAANPQAQKSTNHPVPGKAEMPLPIAKE